MKQCKKNLLHISTIFTQKSPKIKAWKGWGVKCWNRNDAEKSDQTGGEDLGGRVESGDIIVLSWAATIRKGGLSHDQATTRPRPTDKTKRWTVCLPRWNLLEPGADTCVQLHYFCSGSTQFSKWNYIYEPATNHNRLKTRSKWNVAVTLRV